MVRNWIFDRFLTEVIKANPRHPELVEELQTAIYHNGLHLDLIRARQGRLADEVLRALKSTAENVVDGKHSFSDMENDPQGREMFCNAIKDLMRHFI